MEQYSLDWAMEAIRMQLTQLLHRAVQHTPDRMLTTFGGRTRTASETMERVARLAAALRAQGVRPNDRVGILALNSDRYLEVLFAVPWAGAVVNPVNIRWSAAEIAFSLDDCRTDVLFVDDAFAHLVPVLRERVPTLRALVYVGDDAAPAGMTDMEALIASSDPVEDAGRGGDDIFGVFYTGGTTGHPKGVVLSHHNMLTSAYGSLATTDLFTSGGVLLHAAPMFHLADLTSLIMGFMRGASHAFAPTFSPEGVIALIESVRVTDTVLVPTMIQLLVESPAIATSDVSSLQRIVYGASPIAEATLHRAFAVFANVRFTQAYGMTELGPIATLLTAADHEDPALLRAAGRPVAHASLRIVDAEGREVPRGTVGEVCVQGDNVMQGYWRRPELTDATIVAGWMRTGDAGYLTEDGYLFVVDRIKDMIVSGGENVYSSEVENALAKHPAVQSCAVIGLPDDAWGERVHAVVVAAEEEAPDAEALRAFCRAHIAGYKIPRSFEFTDSLPISAAGKVLKTELRARHRPDEAHRSAATGVERL